jgi:hypothetical protein
VKSRKVMRTHGGCWGPATQLSLNAAIPSEPLPFTV